jgi:signal transduction histidine kinase
VDLAAITRDVVERFSDEAVKARCTVEVASESVVGDWDRLRLEQIVTNLLTNAFKFGPGHSIEIAVARAGANARLTVTDHGIGIAREDLDRIFRRFEQAGSTRGHGGLGLGLYIVRGIVEAHGGTIRVDSEPEMGSTFTIELPVSRDLTSASPSGEAEWHSQASGR